MSHDTDRERGPESEAVLEQFEHWYHVPAVLAVLAYMLWTRLDAYGEFVRDDGVFFRGNDAYYHYRATMYSVENWPRQLYADPWTNFPYGTTVGNFGSLMDQVVATVALIVGLGDPTARQVGIVAVVAPAVIGTLCVLLVYGIATLVSDSRLAGVTAAAVLALVPQSAWVRRSTVGFYDHHVAEAFMMAAAVLAMVYAISVARQERPVYEQVLDRDWDGLAPTVKASALAGVVLGLYLHVWAPGQVLIGIFGVFFLLGMVHAVVRGESPEHLGTVGIVAMGTALLVIFPWTLGFEINNSELSFLQALLLVAVGAGCAFLARLARYWDRQSLEPQGYPVAVAGVGLLSVATVWIVFPQALDAVVGGLSRIVLLGTSETTLTVGEAQPMDTDNLGEEFYVGYGFTFFTAVLALFWIAARTVLSRQPRAEHLLLVVWTVFLVSMAITQVRFHYYLVLAVAVLNGWLVVQVVRLMEFPEITAPERIETYHVMTVLVILMVLFVPVTVGAFTDDAGTLTAAETAESQQPGTVQLWQENMDWMSESTPQPGAFGGEDNAMSYYGPFDTVEDYEYPPGAYGVLSWWDYGHWITVDGERIPTANPFQQGPRSASAFLQETDEDRANMYLEALPVESGNLDELSDEELQTLADERSEQQAQEEVRYVTIDDQMAGGKFSAITEWAGPDAGAYTERQPQQVAGEERQILSRSEQYDETMLSRLYFQDAQGLEHYRLVKEDSRQQIIASVAQQQGEDVYQPVAIGLDVQTLNRVLPQRILEIAQDQADSRYALYDVRQESAVKTFERVEGATITGTAQPNETVRATVSVDPGTDRYPRLPIPSDFRYQQETTADEDGQFELTVPYSTDNQLGPEDGYTDTDAVANGTYTVEAGEFTVTQEGQLQFQATERADGVTVPEPAIYEGSEIDVDLEEIEQPEENATDGSESEAAGSGTATSDAAVSGSGTDTAAGTGSDAGSSPVSTGAAQRASLWWSDLAPIRYGA